jgi:hypothetical protein
MFYGGRRINWATNRLPVIGGFTCDVLAVTICKLFESDSQNLLVLLQVIRYRICFYQKLTQFSGHLGSLEGLY